MKSYATPKRQRFFFLTKEGAESFADLKREQGARDVVVVPKGEGRGATVMWTEFTED